jgi:hypothetical protein
MRSAISLGGIALAAALLSGCSRSAPIGSDRLRSEIRAARSYAAESDLLLDLVLRQTLTPRFAAEHAAYLAAAVLEAADALPQAAAEPDGERALRLCRAQLRLLARELYRVRGGIGDTGNLAAARPALRRIRESLETAEPPR